MQLKRCFPDNTFPIVTFLIVKKNGFFKEARNCLRMKDHYQLKIFAFGKSNSIKGKMMRFGLSVCAFGGISILSFAVPALFVAF